MAFEMGKQSNRRVRVAALILGLVGLTLAAASVPVSAQVGWREPPAAALDRHIRVLARSPKDFLALIGAGKAALELGDSHAAVGFFGRADEVFPSSPLPQAGMGAAALDGTAAGTVRHAGEVAALERPVDRKGGAVWRFVRPRTPPTCADAHVGRCRWPSPSRTRQCRDA
jgi:hypothetical protein